ncbi:hypothetical protein [Nitrosomonas sp. ANs5]
MVIRTTFSKTMGNLPYYLLGEVFGIKVRLTLGWIAALRSQRRDREK